MKINTNAFIEFVTKASLNGTIRTINIEFTESGLLSSVNDTSQTTLTLTKMSKDATENYAVRDEIYIKDTTGFLKALKKLDETFDFEVVEDYIMKIETTGRDSFITLGSEMICENKQEPVEPKVEYTTTFTIPKTEIAPAVQDTKDLGVTHMVIEKKKEGVSFTVGNKGETDYFITKFSSENTGTGKVKLGEMFLKVFAVIDNELEMSIKTDHPCRIKETTEFVEFVCVIAPIVDN